MDRQAKGEAAFVSTTSDRGSDQKGSPPRQVERHNLGGQRGGTERHPRQYDAEDPANRLVASELEARWNKALARMAKVEGKIVAHDGANPAPVADPTSLATLAVDLKAVWTDPSTDARLKKRIVRTVIHAQLEQ